MAAKRSIIYELWGVSENEVFSAKKESIILRISSNAYMKKSNARPVKSNEQLVKLELGYDNHVSKALSVYIPTDSEFYQRLEAFFDEYATMHMTDIKAVSVTQARRGYKS